MPAHEFEADEALEEGVRIHWLRTIRAIDGSAFTVEVMELDGNGRPRATGRTETLDADDLILALGQDTDTTFLRAVPGIAFEDDGTVIVGTDMMTGHPGIFAGGDMVPAERTVTTAVGHGRRAAHHIDAWLRGASYAAETRPVATLEKLRLWYSTDVAASEQARLPLEVRTGSFREVVSGIDAEQAAFEAGRCLSCGNCFECDACYAACPEDAILKLGPGQRYAFDYALCTGCAVCFEGCPCHAIDMIPEPAATA